MKTRLILRYGMMKRLKRGVRLSIALTFRCSLRCPYCVVDKPTGKTPKTKESSLDELKDFVRKFPYRLQEVKLTGGSPELHPDFVEFVHWLLGRGLFVAIFTNLMQPEQLQRLRKSRKLIFIASYHYVNDWQSTTPEKYIKTYNDLVKDYRVEVDEIGNIRRLPFSRLKPFLTEIEMKTNHVMIRVAPDLKMYLDCYDVYLYS